jgi:hypothetical protein
MREDMVSVTECSRLITIIGRSCIATAGKTATTPPASELELSFDNLQQDFIAMLTHIFPDPEDCPDLIVRAKGPAIQRSIPTLTPCFDVS